MYSVNTVFTNCFCRCCCCFNATLFKNFSCFNRDLNSGPTSGASILPTLLSARWCSLQFVWVLIKTFSVKIHGWTVNHTEVKVRNLGLQLQTLKKQDIIPHRLPTCEHWCLKTGAIVCHGNRCYLCVLVFTCTAETLHTSQILYESPFMTS